MLTPSCHVTGRAVHGARLIASDYVAWLNITERLGVGVGGVGYYGDVTLELWGDILFPWHEEVNAVSILLEMNG